MIHKHLLICKLPCISFASLVCYGLQLASLGTKLLCLQLCLPSVSVFEILFVAKYIGNTNADFIHALS